MATPVWALLVASRIVFYALERLRFPDIVPPVTADAIQGVLLWPVAVTACYVALRCWTRFGVMSGIATAIATACIFGLLARPAYAIGSWLRPSDEAQLWLQSFPAHAPDFWYAWGSNTVEYAAMYVSCLAATFGLLSFRNLMTERVLRARVEASVAQERLRTLRAQLNPHFLFNALNSIVSLGETQPPASHRLITLLSDLLRRTLRASECEQHELADELAYVEAYLHIQQLRQPLRVTWALHATEHCLDLAVPSLVLLPLVENAVTHGLRGGAVSVHIDIRAHRSRDCLDLAVSNTCHRLNVCDDSTGSGLGLRNVRERLAMLYGSRASLAAHRTRAQLFEATIHIPYSSGHSGTAQRQITCAL